MPSKSDDLTEFADFHQGYVSAYIQLADAKAGVVLAVSGGLIGYLLAQGSVRSAVTSAELVAVVPGGALAALALAFGLAFSVIRPRRGPPTGVVYFEAVAAHETDENYVAALKSKSAMELAEVRIEHCHALSVICSRKYRVLVGSIWAGLGGMILTCLSIAALGL
jgi:hypothetical protein